MNAKKSPSKATKQKEGLSNNVQAQSYPITEATATPILLSKLAGVGIVLDDIKYDCGLYRAYNKGDKPRTTNIAVIGHSSPIFTIWAENHKTGEKFSFSVADKNAKPPSRAEQRRQTKARKKALLKQKALREQGYKDGAIKALNIWKQLPPATVELPYLKSKMIDEVEGLRTGRGGSVCVPMFNSGRLSGLQIITKTSKKIMGGSRLGGSFFVWGKISKTPDVLYLSESLSSAFAVYKMTGKPCIVCFSAGNLLAVGEKVRAKYKNTRLIFACDNDIRKSSDAIQTNVGIFKAKEAAQIIGGAEIAIPKLESGVACDFWDVWEATQGGAK